MAIVSILQDKIQWLAKFLVWSGWYWHGIGDLNGVDVIFLRFLDPMKTRQGRYVCVVWHDLWPDRLMDRDGNSGSAQSFPSTRYQTNTVKMKCFESFHSNVSSLKPTQISTDM